MRSAWQFLTFRIAPVSLIIEFMPTEDERAENAPDTREPYERGVPEKEPGLGEMGKTDNTPHEQEDAHPDSRANKLDEREVTAHETEDRTDSVDPADADAHGDRADADEAEATGRRHQGGKSREGNP